MSLFYLLINKVLKWLSYNYNYEAIIFIFQMLIIKIHLNFIKILISFLNYIWEYKWLQMIKYIYLQGILQLKI